MFQLSTINYDGGKRTYHNVEVKVHKITEERSYRLLWLRKTQVICLEVLKKPTGVFQNAWGETIPFPTYFIIHDFDKEFSDLTIGKKLTVKIGYADTDQQHWHKVNAFSIER